MDKTLTEKDILLYREKYDADRENRVREHAVTSVGIGKAGLDLSCTRELEPVFSIDVDCGGVTNQKRSGRCWMFAGLNVLRKILIDALKVKDFECSQAYLQFYDKLEKANFFMEGILSLAKEDISSRNNVFLLDSGIGDGGHWAMFVNLVRKYGIVPSAVLPDTTVNADTGELNVILSRLLKQDALVLREIVRKKGLREARKRKDDLLAEIYRVLSISLGQPPQSFDFEYRDKDNVFHREEGLTPKSFYEKYVKTSLAEYVSLTDAPIHGWKKGTKYTCPLVNNVVGGENVIFYNSDMKIIKDGAILSLKNGEPLWFAADVSEQSLRKEGFLDSRLFDYEALFRVELIKDKGKRLDSRISFSNHAMCLTGVDLDSSGCPLRWKVENSWGKENGKDGFFVMSDAWFTDNVYQVIINRKYLPKKVVNNYDRAETVEVDPFNGMFGMPERK